MLRFYSDLGAYLNTLGLFATPRLGSLDKTGNDISIVPITSTGRQKYYDGDSLIPFMFQILTKSPSQADALNGISQIADALDGYEAEYPTYKITLCSVYTEPSWIEKNSQNEHIYSAVFRAEVERSK